MRFVSRLALGLELLVQQKWSSCSWLLLREFVKRRQEQEREVETQIAAGEKSPEALEDLPLPKIPFVRADPSIYPSQKFHPSQFECRQIMTRTDFLEGA